MRGSDQDVVIRAEGVSKKFCRNLRRSLWYGVLDTVDDLTGRSRSDRAGRPDEFWAVDDVSFTLRRGECLGVIGRNGAGKTTLLKLLNGLIKPDRGRIEMRGRVGALISLGAGFNPVLTGRENIYVNGAVLGFSRRELTAKIDEIIDFAEIEAFIDTPVQNYSSGMQVRLGFSIASAFGVDILLLDEVLAVGDAAFRMKCHRRMGQILADSSVIFVTHDMAQVARICDQTLVLAGGRTVFCGPTADGIGHYNVLNQGNDDALEDQHLLVYPPLERFDLVEPPHQIRSGEALKLRIGLSAEAAVEPVELRVNIHNMAGDYAADCVLNSSDHGVRLLRGRSEWCVELASVPLRAGRYTVSFSIADRKGQFLASSYKRHLLVVEGGHPGTVADCQLNVRSWMSHAREAA